VHEDTGHCNTIFQGALDSDYRYVIVVVDAYPGHMEYPMSTVLLTFLALLCVSPGTQVQAATAPEREFRIDFPYTEIDTPRLRHVNFESQDTSGVPELTESGIVSALGAVINSGLVHMLSITIFFSEDGYISGVSGVVVETKEHENFPIRVLIAYHDAKSNDFFAHEQFHPLLGEWVTAREQGRTYEDLKVPRGKDTGVQTLISFFCTKEPCPGKFPIQASK